MTARTAKPSTVLKAVYTLGELAHLAGISRWRMTRELEATGVTIHRRGRWRIVYLGALRRGNPELWDGILYRKRLIDS